jgi:hypothetical protein
VQGGLASRARHASAAAGNKRAWLAVTLAAIATSATTAYAQFGGGPSAGGTGGRRGGRNGPDRRKGGDGKADGRTPVNQLEITLHEFHDDLKLTAAQEPAWQSFADSVRTLADDLAREQVERRAPSSLGMLQRIDRAVDLARNRFTAVEDTADAAKRLYTSLTPEQQAAADPRLANIVMTALWPPMPGGGQSTQQTGR